MKDKKYHYVYKTTNLINGKYYIGVHSSSRVDDGYLGSGTALVKALQKHGEENFKREILEFVDTAEEKWVAEIRYVTLEVVKDPNSYNQAPGGRNWIAAMKRTNDPNLSDHQSKAGRSGAKSYLASMTEEERRGWHSKGGKISAMKTVANKTGIHSDSSKEKKKIAVSAAIKGTIELWHPDAPETVTNRNSQDYMSGWSVRVKPDSDRYKDLLAQGYVQRQSVSDIVRGK